VVRPRSEMVDFSIGSSFKIRLFRPALSQALRIIQSDRETVWYRKVDSTLRGNIGSEVLSTVSAIPGKRVIFCAPAFPDTGRTTALGKVFVDGVPLEESVFTVDGRRESRSPISLQKSD
jgi:D-threonate/D-erythronate kinase